MTIPPQNPDDEQQVVRPRTMDHEEYWCMIQYHEQERRVGESAKPDMTQNFITVAAYRNLASPNSPIRVSLGLLDNPNRSAQALSTLAVIGDGFNLRYNEGQITLENVCDCDLHVQSVTCNYIERVDLHSVAKIPHGLTVVVFSFEIHERMRRLSYNLDLEGMLHWPFLSAIRVSFLYGWGENYRPYTFVRDTPCWVNILPNWQMLWQQHNRQRQNLPRRRRHSN